MGTAGSAETAVIAVVMCAVCIPFITGAAVHCLFLGWQYKQALYRTHVQLCIA
jgi:hypothetical protein